MNVIYLSSCCSNQKFAELREKGITRKLPQAQKYHCLLMEGIADCIDGTLYSISAFPVNRQWTKQVRFPAEEETVGKICFFYDAFLNMNLFRQHTRKKAAMRRIRKLYAMDHDCIIICDVLNQSLANAARACGKKYGIPVLGIVTDVPGHTSGARRKTLSFVNRMISRYGEKQAIKNLNKYDAYLLLTEAMNPVVNTKGKPYIVIEGHSDAKMAEVPNTLAKKASPKIAMYAGGIHKEFGIARMVNAFLKGAFEDWELHIYGDGNYQNELKAVAASNPSVKYFGTAPNELIVQKQLEATLLLNPRLTDAEYVKYSFPSKTMECMASGTPLLTTRLPGMPKEYYSYVYFFESETEEGMLQAFREVTAHSPEELCAFGSRAKTFVMSEKTNTVQAKKLMDFIATLPRKEK